MSAIAAAIVAIGADRPASAAPPAAVSARAPTSRATPAASMAPVTPLVDGRAGIGETTWIAEHSAVPPANDRSSSSIAPA